MGWREEEQKPMKQLIPNFQRKQKMLGGSLSLFLSQREKSDYIEKGGEKGEGRERRKVI